MQKENSSNILRLNACDVSAAGFLFIKKMRIFLEDGLVHFYDGLNTQSTIRTNFSYHTNFEQLKMFDTPGMRTSSMFAFEADTDKGIIIKTDIINCIEQRISFEEFLRQIHDDDVQSFKQIIKYRPGQPQKRVDIELRMSAGGAVRKNKLKGMVYSKEGHAYMTGLFYDAENVAAQAARLEYLEKFDIKSGLANAQMLDAIFEDISRYGMYPQTLIVADIDRFKYINDSLGYHAGDTLIKNVADVLKDCFFDAEIIARISGGEYCAVYAGKSRLEIDHKIKEAQMMLHGMYLNLIKAEVSFGYAFIEKGSDFCTLYSQSTQNLRRARNIRKLLSGNSIVDSINRSIEQRVNWGKRQTRLQSMSTQIAGNLGCDEECSETLKVLAKIADLGFIGIDTHIIKKRAVLSPEEYDQYLPHIEIGRDIIASIDEVSEYEGLYLDIFKRYDEWQDAIAMPSRILTGAIGFDDIMYACPKVSFSQIKENVLKKRGKEYCPLVADAILEVAGKHYA